MRRQASQLSTIGARIAGVLFGLFLGRWAFALISARQGLSFLEKTEASARNGVTTATQGTVVPDPAVPLGSVFSDVSFAFGVLVGLMALVVLVVALFPWERWARRGHKAP